MNDCHHTFEDEDDINNNEYVTIVKCSKCKMLGEKDNETDEIVYTIT